jgi:F-type H+-transporting ATPase subunit b
MQETIQQVGTLLLGALPTLILFILLVLAYQFLVQQPLSKTLAERRARTTGAVEAAHKAIAAAEAKTADYANKLRLARAEVFKIREQRLREWAQERDGVLETARKAASHRVLEAKVGIAAEVAAARKTLLAGADNLAEQVVRAVLPAAAGGSR